MGDMNNVLFDGVLAYVAACFVIVSRRGGSCCFFLSSFLLCFGVRTGVLGWYFGVSKRFIRINSPLSDKRDGIDNYGDVHTLKCVYVSYALAHRCHP